MYKSLYGTAKIRTAVSYLCVSDFLVHITFRQVALDAIQILGGNGYINDYPTGRYLRYEKSVHVLIRLIFFSKVSWFLISIQILF